MKRRGFLAALAALVPASFISWKGTGTGSAMALLRRTYRMAGVEAPAHFRVPHAFRDQLFTEMRESGAPWSIATVHQGRNWMVGQPYQAPYVEALVFDELPVIAEKTDIITYHTGDRVFKVRA